MCIEYVFKEGVNGALKITSGIAAATSDALSSAIARNAFTILSARAYSVYRCTARYTGSRARELAAHSSSLCFVFYRAKGVFKHCATAAAAAAAFS